jgi:coenzyme F420 hydrogenase subunit beta
MDPVVREKGSAGGVVTALLLSALEQGLITGALVVGNDVSEPTRPRVAVARTPDEIRAAAQSKYCLAPVNSILDRSQGANDRLGIVALPCQAHGLQLARAVNLDMARKVAFVIGVFCGFNVKYEGTTYLLRKLGIHPEEVATLEYRGGPWPGGFRVVTVDGREGFVSKHQYTYVHLMYAPEGCWYCPDLTAEFADKSVGDYWVSDERGYSTVIGRTAAGQALLEAAVARDDVSLDAIGYEDLLASHRHLLHYKKFGVQVRRSLSRRKPVEGYRLPTLTARDRGRGTLFYSLMRFSSSRVGRYGIGLLPLSITGFLSARGRDAFRRGSSSSSQN